VTGPHTAALAAAEKRARDAGERLWRAMRDPNASARIVELARETRDAAEAAWWQLREQIEEAEARGRPALTIPGKEQAEKIRATAARPLRVVRP
jgi:hypothetical protein